MVFCTHLQCNFLLRSRAVFFIRRIVWRVTMGKRSGRPYAIKWKTRKQPVYALFQTLFLAGARTASLCSGQFVERCPAAASNTLCVSALLHQILENSDLARPCSVVEKASQSRDLGLFFGLRQCARDLQGVRWGSAR